MLILYFGIIWSWSGQLTILLVIGWVSRVGHGKCDISGVLCSQQSLSITRVLK